MIRKSPWVSLVNASDCTGCIIEELALFTPKYDIERFGCLWKESVRHADVLLVSGPVNKQMKERLKRIYRQMAKDRIVIAVGSCAISGGVYAEGYNTIGGVDKVIPVDMYVPGCPPRPEAIIDGLMKALGVRYGKKKGKK